MVRYRGVIFMNFLSKKWYELIRKTQRVKFSTTSGPLLNALYHSYARVFDKVDSTEVFCNIFSDSAHKILFAMENLRQIVFDILIHWKNRETHFR